MDQKTIILIVVVGVLVMFGAVQMYQINSLRDSLSGGIATQTVATQQGAGAGAGNVPANIQNLPSMVGGC